MFEPPTGAVSGLTTPVKPPTALVKPRNALVKPPTAPVKPRTTAVKPLTALVKPLTTLVMPPTTPVRGFTTIVRPRTPAVRSRPTAEHPPPTPLPPRVPVTRPPNRITGRPPPPATPPTHPARPRQPSSAAGVRGRQPLRGRQQGAKGLRVRARVQLPRRKQCNPPPSRDESSLDPFRGAGSLRPLHWSVLWSREAAASVGGNVNKRAPPLRRIQACLMYVDAVSSHLPFGAVTSR